MSEYALTINFILKEKTFTIEKDNPCVSISEELGDTDKDCNGNAIGLLSALLKWIGGEPLSDEEEVGSRIYSSSIVVQDLTGNGYTLGSVGSELGPMERTEKEITEQVDIVPGDAVDGFVDISALLDKIPDRIISISKPQGMVALDENFKKNYGWSFAKSGDGITVSDPAHASLSVRYIATVDVYGQSDNGDSGYHSVVYSVGACGRIDSADVHAPSCFKDGQWLDSGFPWEDDSDTIISDAKEPEAKQVDAEIVYDFCTKELKSASPNGIVPDGSCWGGRRWPSGEKCNG